jgi:hypothetical protein
MLAICEIVTPLSIKSRIISSFPESFTLLDFFPLGRPRVTPSAFFLGLSFFLCDALKEGSL